MSTLTDSLPNIVKEKILKKVKTQEWQNEYINSQLDDIDLKTIFGFATAYYSEVVIPKLLAENDEEIIEEYMRAFHFLDYTDDATNDLNEIKELLDMNEEE